MARKPKPSACIPVYSIAYSPDGKLLASGGADNLVKIWDVVGMKELKQLKGHDMPVTGVAFAGDSATLVSIGLDRTIRVWNVADGKETKKLGPTTDDPYGLAWATKAKRLAVCGYSGQLSVWDIVAGKSIFAAKIKSPGYTVAIDTDANVLFSGHDNGSIQITPIVPMK